MQWQRLLAADMTEPPGYRLLQSLRDFPGHVRHLFVGSASLNGAGVGGVAVKAAAQNASLNGHDNISRGPIDAKFLIF